MGSAAAALPTLGPQASTLVLLLLLQLCASAVTCAASLPGWTLTPRASLHGCAWMLSLFRHSLSATLGWKDAAVLIVRFCWL